MRRNREGSSGKRPVTSGLRRAIQKRHLTAYATAKKAHVSIDSVQRFMNQERGLSLGTVDKIADALDLKICEEDAPSESR